MKKIDKICFFGGGSWGQALAITLAKSGYQSSILVSDQERMHLLNNNKSSCFPNIKFPNLVNAFVDQQKLSNYNLIFITTESFRVEESLKIIYKQNPNSRVIITSKGFANLRGKTFPEIILEKYPKLIFGVLTGPTFADEVAKNLPAAALIASKNKNLANLVSQLFFQTSLRLYLSNDVIGASIAGAVKNIMAIGAGISDGLCLGDNAKAGLITRGIEETCRVIEACGGKKETVFGLAGIGDMTLTCSTPHSRNMRYGMELVKNRINTSNPLVEGVHALKAAKHLSKELNVDTPIINSIYDIINDKKDVKIIISELFKRPIKKEF